MNMEGRLLVEDEIPIACASAERTDKSPSPSSCEMSFSGPSFAMYVASSLFLSLVSFFSFLALFFSNLYASFCASLAAAFSAFSAALALFLSDVSRASIAAIGAKNNGNMPPSLHEEAMASQFAL